MGRTYGFTGQLRRDGKPRRLWRSIPTGMRVRASRPSAQPPGSIDELIGALDSLGGLWIHGAFRAQITGRHGLFAALQVAARQGATDDLDGGATGNYHDLPRSRPAQSAPSRGISFIGCRNERAASGDCRSATGLMRPGDKERSITGGRSSRPSRPPDGFLTSDQPAPDLVKMVHKPAFEYGMLQPDAEGLPPSLQAKRTSGAGPHAIAHLLNQGSVVRSWLLELAERAFRR